MRYAVRVTSPGKKTKYDEFETTDTEKYDEVEADARSAYAEAARSYSLENTVWLIRDNVVLGNARGVGSDSLDDEDPAPEEKRYRRVFEEHAGGGVAVGREEVKDDDDEDARSVEEDRPFPTE